MTVPEPPEVLRMLLPAFALDGWQAEIHGVGEIAAIVLTSPTEQFTLRLRGNELLLLPTHTAIHWGELISHPRLRRFPLQDPQLLESIQAFINNYRPHETRNFEGLTVSQRLDRAQAHLQSPRYPHEPS